MVSTSLAISPVKNRRPSKPMNSFMVFAQEYRPIIAQNNRAMPNAEVSKQLGRAWRSLSEQEKEPYRKKAEELKQEFDEKNCRKRRKRAGSGVL